MNNNYIGIDLDYFRQPIIQRLEVTLGDKALNTYLKICLKLAEIEQPIKIADVPMLVREFFCTQELLNQIINFPGLFSVSNDCFSSSWVTSKLAIANEKKERLSEAGKLGAKNRWNKEKNSKANGNANGDAIATPLATPLATPMAMPMATKLNKTKEKENKVNENIKEIMDTYNSFLNKKVKSSVAWEENFLHWLEIYTLEEIKEAILELQNPNWWSKNNTTLELLFRTKNKGGKCDYIGELRNLPKTDKTPNQNPSKTNIPDSDSEWSVTDYLEQKKNPVDYSAFTEEERRELMPF